MQASNASTESVYSAWRALTSFVKLSSSWRFFSKYLIPVSQLGFLETKKIDWTPNYSIYFLYLILVSVKTEREFEVFMSSKQIINNASYLALPYSL